MEKLYRYPDFRDSLVILMTYIILALLIIFPGGWIICSLLAAFFDNTLFDTIRDTYFWCVGFLIAGLIFGSLMDRIVLRKTDAMTYTVMANEFFGDRVWLLYNGAETHIVNFLNSTIFEKFNVSKIVWTTQKDAPLSIPAQDDELKVWVTLTITPIDPRYMMMTNSKDSAQELAISATTGLLEFLFAGKHSANIIGKNSYFHDKINSWINQDPSIELNGFAVNVQIKNVDNSDAIKSSKSQGLESLYLEDAVDKLMGEGNTPGEGSVTREQALAALVALKGYGTYIHKTEREIHRYEGDTGMLELAAKFGFARVEALEDDDNDNEGGES